MNPNPLTDRQLESSIANMLRFGVILSASIVLLGGVFYLVRGAGAVPTYSHFAGESAPLRTIPGVFHGVLHFHAKSVIMLGILLLIATPVVRVLFCVVGFARQRDWLYVAISATVLAILIFSLIHSGA